MECPRVVAYYKIGANLEITLHNDFITDLDVMALDIKRAGDTSKAMRVINIYNQKELGANPSITYTSNHITNLQWDPTTPTIITSDWNIRHPQWDSRVTTACPRTHEMLEWLDGNGFTLCNKPFIPTREDPRGYSSVIDLTFKNPAANGGNILKKHYVDTSIRTLSDHHTIILQVGEPGQTITNPTTNQLNWKHADKEEFKKALKELLEDNRDEYEQIVSEFLNSEKQHAMPDELDRATDFIQQLLESMARKAVPTHRICSKSKPWWTPELSKAYANLWEAHSHMHGWIRHFHTPSILLPEWPKLTRKSMLQLIRKTKNEYYWKMVNKATSQNIWTFCKWTTTNNTYMSPPLDQGENIPPTVTHAQKCNTLRRNLFPELPQLENEPEPDWNEHPEDIAYYSVTKREVKDTIFTAAQLNAPGLSGLTGRAWRWAWEVLEEAMYNLIRLCADSGYHPKSWRTSITVTLQKPNRDYSKPRSYRLIHLLKVLGKTLERLQAPRLLYYAAHYKLL